MVPSSARVRRVLSGMVFGRHDRIDLALFSIGRRRSPTVVGAATRLGAQCTKAATFLQLPAEKTRLRRGRHDLKSTVVIGMRLGRVLAVVGFCGLPAVASAQGWADAYRARDYVKAADLLHQVIISPPGQDAVSLLPEYRQLALMYADGFGVEKDPFAACMMANRADAATKRAAAKLVGSDVGAYDAAVSESESFVATHCDPLSEDDRLTAASEAVCFAFGMPERTERVGGRTIRIG